MMVCLVDKLIRVVQSYGLFLLMLGWGMGAMGKIGS